MHFLLCMWNYTLNKDSYICFLTFQCLTLPNSFVDGPVLLVFGKKVLVTNDKVFSLGGIEEPLSFYHFFTFMGYDFPSPIYHNSSTLFLLTSLLFCTFYCSLLFALFIKQLKISFQNLLSCCQINCFLLLISWWRESIIY